MIVRECDRDADFGDMRAFLIGPRKPAAAEITVAHIRIF
jgi:hypothetical protein